MNTKTIATTAAEKAAEKKNINLVSRVDRSPLITFFQNKTGFRSLPIYENNELSREDRILTNVIGWEVPSSCFGRSGVINESRREALRAWINQHLSHYIPEGEAFMIALEEWHEVPKIVIYRRHIVEPIRFG